MKIAIQSNKPRGKEIISLLESLGGNNKSDTGRTFIWKGNSSDPELYYYIDENGYIQLNPCPKDYKPYTLEEFEKEFPFKVGDTVLLTGVNRPRKIVALELYMDKLCYKLDSGLHYRSESLMTYKEMKEERNITFTLDKAKEWYKKGGELKEIALQAFTEKELNPLPKSWEEFCKNYPVQKGESWIGSQDTIYCATVTQNRMYKNWIPSKESAEAHLAMIQLEQLRDCWRQGNIPRGLKYKIRKTENKYTVLWGPEDAFLSFCDKQTAEEFLECFRDLIEQAGDLI